VPPSAHEIVIADEPDAWERLGFLVDGDGSFQLGGLRIVAAGAGVGEGIVRLAVEGLPACRERPDGLAIVAGEPFSSRAGRAAPHPNGALAVDHVVAFTDALPRTLAALEAAGMEVRRIREPPESPARQAFLRLGEVVLEVVETGRPPVAFWGLVIVVADLAACAELLGPLLGRPRDAVQPGRRIATVRPEASLSVALALMAPRPPQPPASS
jgi:hypothetical protein